MSVAYFVQTHKDPPQILRLLRALRRAGARGPIFLQHDAHALPLDEGYFAGVEDLRFHPTHHRKTRGTLDAQTGPYLALLETLERSGELQDIDWLANITGQDYPVRRLDEAERELGAGGIDGYLRFWDVLSPESPWSRRKARRRYWYRYTRIGEAWLPWLRRARWLLERLPGVHAYLDYGPFVGLRRRRTPFGAGFRCQGGWAFYTLSRPCLRALAQFPARHPEVMSHYATTIAPDESLVQTILVNAGSFRLADDCRRYIDYRRAVGGSPRTLGAADFDELASGRYDFARKFERGASDALADRIDRELLAASAVRSGAPA